MSKLANMAPVGRRYLLLVEHCRSDTQSKAYCREGRIIELIPPSENPSVDTTPGLVDLANLGLQNQGI